MKAIHAFFVLFLMGFAANCSTIYDVQYHYDKQTNFENLKTYDWMAVPEKADTNNLVVELLKKAVNAELQAKGLMMTSNNPDFLITEHLGRKDKAIGNRSSGYGMPEGYSGPKNLSTHQFKEGSLILDFVDAESKKVIWRGATRAGIDYVNTPELKEKLINEAAQEILKKFPPKSKE